MNVLSEDSLTPPAQFDFPFAPYSIQHEFMVSLYNTLENGKLGIFESPTGTVSGSSVNMCLKYISFKIHIVYNTF